MRRSARGCRRLRLIGMTPDEFIGVTLERSGRIEMPIAYATWLDEASLVDTFDAWWSERLDVGTHGDAFTPFAERHFAPVDVQQCLRRLI